MALPAAARAMKKRGSYLPSQQTTEGIHYPAPIGGINALDPARDMPPTDALQLYNMIPFRYGLRVRSGWQEWATGAGLAAPADYGLYDDGSPMAYSLSGPLGGAMLGAWLGTAAYGVRTLIGFNGSIPANDRLFACCEDGIYDVTGYGTTAPTRVFDFPVDAGTGRGNLNAGYGNYTTFVNQDDDHFIAYCDGFWGYLLYSEATGTWSQVLLGDRTNPAPRTVYSSAASNLDIDPRLFRHVSAWKGRLWFAVEGSTTGWYLPINQFAGEVNPIFFGSRFRHGGSLAGMWSWTVDGGTGIDDLLVAISTSGDVLIYEGFDPATPGAFALRGVWWVGEVPPGRNLASQFGGDLFILSRLGCLPLSKLVAGGLIRDPTIYATAKISNLFNILMTERGDRIGWGIQMHQTDNLMVINVPATPDKVQQQITMSLASKGWSEHIGIPMQAMETWKGKLYFGTWDNRVCTNDGYMDGMKLDGTGAAAIDFALLTAYQDWGNVRKKMVRMVKPLFSTDDTVPGYSAEARFDFDLAPISVSPVAIVNPGSVWGTAIWDTALWDDGVGTANEMRGTTGMGNSVAVILRGTAKTNLTLIGFDVLGSSGGLL